MRVSCMFLECGSPIGQVTLPMSFLHSEEVIIKQTFAG